MSKNYIEKKLELKKIFKKYIKIKKKYTFEAGKFAKKNFIKESSTLYIER